MLPVEFVDRERFKKLSKKPTGYKIKKFSYNPMHPSKKKIKAISIATMLNQFQDRKMEPKKSVDTVEKPAVKKAKKHKSLTDNLPEDT